MAHRPAGIGKLGNGYLSEISPDTYRDIPKAVFAAIALSPAINGGVSLTASDDTEFTPTQYVINEWRLLHSQGVVPQSVPARLLAILPTEAR